MQAPKQFEKDATRLKILAYGVPGSGKTTFASTAAEIGKVLFINVEGGMLSIPARYQENILVIDLKNTPEQTAIEQFEETLYTLSYQDFKANPWLEGIETVVLDSGSEFANIALESIVRKRMEINPRHEADEVWLEDYGWMNSSLTRLFRHLRDIPYHVIMTALSQTMLPPQSDSDRKSAITPEPLEVKPAFTKKLAESTMGFYDCVWHFYMKTSEGTNEEGNVRIDRDIYVLTQPYRIYRAKTRGSNFPDELGHLISNPLFSTIMQTLRESETGDR